VVPVDCDDPVARDVPTEVQFAGQVDGKVLRRAGEVVPKAQAGAGPPLQQQHHASGDAAGRGQCGCVQVLRKEMGGGLLPELVKDVDGVPLIAGFYCCCQQRIVRQQRHRDQNMGVLAK